MTKILMHEEPVPGVRNTDYQEWTVKRGVVAVDPPSIATVSRGSAAVTVTGVKVGDIFIPDFQPAISDDLIFVGAKITANDTVTFYFYNPTAGAIDDAVQNWDYIWIKRVL